MSDPFRRYRWRWFDLELPSEGRSGIHAWFGPVGVHLFWPPWKSRPDWIFPWKTDVSA